MNSSLERSSSLPKSSAWLPEEIFNSAPQPDSAEIEQIENLFAAPQKLSPALGHSGLIKDSSVATNIWNLSEMARHQAVRKPAFNSIESSRTNPVMEDASRISSLEANNILTEAQRQADEIRQSAALEAEEIKQKAYAEGLAQGRQELTSALNSVTEMLAEFQQMSDEYFQNSEGMVIDLVKEIAHNLFGSGLNLDPQSLHDTFSTVLANARSFGDLKVFLNPADVSRLDPNWIESQSLTYGQKIQFIASDDIQPGGCYISGEQGAVDARVDTRLNSLIQTLDQTNS